MECIMLTETAQFHKDRSHVGSLIYEVQGKEMVCGSERERNMGVQVGRRIRTNNRNRYDQNTLNALMKMSH